MLQVEQVNLVDQVQPEVIIQEMAVMLIQLQKLVVQELLY
jgi:hypothetical protein